MFGAPKAVHRIGAGALIASTILLRPSASNALDNVIFTTDFGYFGRNAFFFVALDKGYYRDAGLDPARIDATVDVVNGAFQLATPVAAADVYAPGFVPK
jgi:NitT/TauT family transport system substrate-binding protein